MELKLQNKMLTRRNLRVLIVPFMELKLDLVKSCLKIVMS